MLRTDPLDPLDTMTEREIFDAALAIVVPGERDAFLNAACEHDARLVEHLRGLLAAGGGLPAGSCTRDRFCARRQPPPKPFSPQSLLARSSARTSSYSQSARAAWARSYMAEQTQPVGTLALKLIKAGMDSRQVLARFGAERQGWP